MRERKTDSFDDTLDFKDNSGNQTSSSEGGDSKNNSPSSESKSSSEESKSSEESSSSSNRTLTAYEESKDKSKDARQPAAEETKTPSPNFSNLAVRPIRR